MAGIPWRDYAPLVLIGLTAVVLAIGGYRFFSGGEEVVESVTPPTTLAPNTIPTTEAPASADTTAAGSGSPVVPRSDAAAAATPEVEDDNLNALFAAEPLLFESNSNTLVPSSVALLDSAAELLKQSPDLRLEVAGHTDSRGTEFSNQRLSLLRAEAVIEALQLRGVTNELTPVGYGESQPVVFPEATADDLQANRRIEFIVLG